MAHHPFYETKPHEQIDPILERMRQMLAPTFGVTVTGNRLTLRWTERGFPRDVHMVILSVNDGEPEKIGESDEP